MFSSPASLHDVFQYQRRLSIQRKPSGQIHRPSFGFSESWVQSTQFLQVQGLTLFYLEHIFFKITVYNTHVEYTHVCICMHAVRVCAYLLTQTCKVMISGLTEHYQISHALTHSWENSPPLFTFEVKKKNTNATECKSPFYFLPKFRYYFCQSRREYFTQPMPLWISVLCQFLFSTMEF